MARTKTKPKKQYLVSIELFPTDTNTTGLLAFISSHLLFKCGYTKSQIARMLMLSERINKISIVSPLAKSQTLEKHLVAFRDQLKVQKLLQGLRRIRYDGEKSLSIGVVYTNTMTCTIIISPDMVKFMYSIGLTVELVCYPGSKS